MEIINGLHSFSGKKPLYLALGNFDGVHRGHQAVIRSAVRQARAAGGSSAALLFDPHPSILLHPQKQFCLLTEIADRVPLMAELGLDYLFVVPFTTWMASLSPENFILEVLCHRFKVSGVSIGVDYSFGCGGAGSEELMQEYGKKLGFAVTVSPMEKAGSTVISSSEIKRLLAGGAVNRAALLLNYYFFRKGKVISGRGRGKKMLYPTANLNPSSHLVWPGSGVYLTAVGGLGKQLHFGVTNVGVKPTFQDDALSVETYILDFTGELYGREITLYFLERLRDTQSFSSASHLREQIGEDIARGRRLAKSLFEDIDAFVEPVRFIRPQDLFYICY